MIKFGLIGLGKMGLIRAKAFEATGQVEIIAAYDVNLPERIPYIIMETAETVIEHPETDAVVISVPNYLNYDLTCLALSLGKHVFCEKPPAFTSEQVKHIRKLEAKSGKTLMYGFNHRHHEAVMEMKKQLDSGKYGKILWMRGRYGKSVDDTYLDTWRARKDQAGGGILFDQGIHMLDLFLYLGGPFDKVHAFVSSLYWKLDDVEDNVFAIMKNSESGMVASLHSTMTQWRHMFSLEVFLESGYMVLNGLKTSSGTYGDEVLVVAENRSKAPAAIWSDEKKQHFATDSSWQHEAEHFMRGINTGKPIAIGNSQDALNVMELIEAIYENERDDANSLNTHLKPIKNVE